MQTLQECGVRRDVCIDDMDMVNIIGAGAQGEVAEVVDRGTSQALAMKVLPLPLGKLPVEPKVVLGAVSQKRPTSVSKFWEIQCVKPGNEIRALLS